VSVNAIRGRRGRRRLRHAKLHGSLRSGACRGQGNSLDADAGILQCDRGHLRRDILGQIGDAEPIDRGREHRCPEAPPRSTAFHCTKRAGGQSSFVSRTFEYGPAQSLQLESGSEVFARARVDRDRAERRTWRPERCFRPTTRCGPSAKKCARQRAAIRTFLPDSFPGPSVKIFPGLAAARNSFPPGPAAIAVTCREVAFTSFE
jgi:hypothetical protein